MGLGLSVVAFALFMTQRQQKEYLWLALQGLNWCIGLPIEITQSFRTLPVGFDYLDTLFGTLGEFFAFVMIFAFVRRKFRGWLRTYIVLSCVCVVAVDWAGWSGVSLPASINILMVPLFAIYAFVLPAVLIAHLRRGNREESILLIPVISWSVVYFLQVIIAAMYAIPSLRNAGSHLG